ncbi:uncharacterized protein LOC128342394 [Hemicordylus capensis]|uniref:uncharacterized protein LOC128342394 n=1 Tax=Hemicordylus capensis TaxID=884348 RepID=UPI002302266B|nr:uncharacterized protein LOC128342394 [Hemicordylus capensis]
MGRHLLTIGQLFWWWWGIEQISNVGRSVGHYRGREIRNLIAVSPSGCPVSSLTLGSSANCPQSLTLLLCNARLVQNNSENIHDLILDEGADLVCITETWLEEAGGLVWSQLLPSGYSAEEQMRGRGQGGGMAVVYKSNISFTRIPVEVSDHIKCVYLSLGTRDRLGLLLVNQSSHCPTESLTEQTDLVSDLALESSRLLVLGYFNVHFGTNLSGVAQEFIAAMRTMGLSQEVSGPTQIAVHMLDLVFHSDQGGVPWVGTPVAFPLSWTDHHLVKLGLTITSSLCRGEGHIRMIPLGRFLMRFVDSLVFRPT